MANLSPDSPIIIPTGSLKLDLALGAGGIPTGSLVEILGSESSGKTSLCLSILSEACKLGKLCAFIDAEQSLTLSRMKSYGLDPDLFHLSQLSQAGRALGIIERLIHSRVFSVIVLDSLNALIPNSDSQIPDSFGSLDHIHKEISVALSKYKRHLSQTNTTVIITRHLFGSARPVYYKLSQNTSRLSVNLHASIILQLEVCSHTIKNGQIEGVQVKASIKKNRFGPCPSMAKLDIMYNDGIIRVGDILDLALQLNILEKSDNQIVYQGQILGDSKEECVDFLLSAPQLCRKIEKEIRQILFSK